MCGSNDSDRQSEISGYYLNGNGRLPGIRKMMTSYYLPGAKTLVL